MTRFIALTLVLFLFIPPRTDAAEPVTKSSSDELAKAANGRGMSLYKARDWAGAAKRAFLP